MGLGGVPPWAFRHRSLLKTSLGSSPMPQLPVLPAGPSKPPENKIAAKGSTKRLRWSHNDILCLVGRLRPHPLAYCPPGRDLVVGCLYPRALPPVTHSSALQAPECLRFVFLPRIERIGRIVSCGRTIRSKSLLLSSGLRPCSLIRMLSHVSELPCLTLHICLVCPEADRKATKQNSCQRQYKMSLHRRLLTVTLDL